MIKYFLFFTSMILSITAFSQKGFDISTGTGFSVPVLSLSSTADTNSGFAVPGINFNAEGRIMFTNNLGISFSGTFNEFKLDTDALYQSFYDSQNDSSFSIESGSWQFRSFALSPVISFPLSEKFILFTKFSGTYSTTNLPYLKQLVTDKSGTPYEIIRESSSSKAFGGNAGLGFRLFLNDHLALFAVSDFYYSKPEFKLLNNQSLSYQASYVNFTFGFTYKFVPVEEDPNKDDEDDQKQQSPFLW